MIIEQEIAFGDPPLFTLRPYQVECVQAIESAFAAGFRRLLVVKATGTGKTRTFSEIARRVMDAGGRVIVLTHTAELTAQSERALREGTGRDPEIEKAGQRASLNAELVCASIQTVSRIDRLTGFPDGHFKLVIVDECHRSLSPSWLRVLCYFHFGEISLRDGWMMPTPEEPYIPLANVIGWTATPDRGDRKTLGEFYQTCPFEFGLVPAVQGGWLVRPIVRNIPLKLDIRGVATTKLSGQSDFDQSQVVARITPFIGEIAKQIAINAADRKTVVFMPSVETATLISEAMVKEGLKASFVSGKCKDREFKIASFDSAPNGSAIACAMLLLEGWDSPSASCVCVLRPTKIRSLLVQAIGRGCRVLPGVIDGLLTPEERLAAIAGSPKRDVLILDFLWLVDKHDLVRPVDIVATKPEIREKMLESSETDLVAASEVAERDLLKSLEREARRHSKKAARTLDPLAWSLSVGDAALASYDPMSKWDELPAHPNQIELLKNAGIDTDKPICRGLAERIVDRIISRERLGLATAKQMKFLKVLGMPEDESALLSKKKAGVMMSILKRRRWRT